MAGQRHGRQEREQGEGRHGRRSMEEGHRPASPQHQASPASPRSSAVRALVPVRRRRPRAESRLRIVARYLILLNQGIPLTPIVELFRMLLHEIRMRIFKKECAVTISDSSSISINS